jgi:gas vesicle structural protein
MSAAPGSVVERSSGAGTLSDVITTVLDKGVVIDVYARVALVGIEIARVDVRVVVASVDTYLRFAEATNRLELSRSEPAGLPELIEETPRRAAKGKTKGVLDAVGEKLTEVIEAGD